MGQVRLVCKSATQDKAVQHGLWKGTVNAAVGSGIHVPLTIYPHTLREIRGYKVIPEVAAYTQSH